MLPLQQLSEKEVLNTVRELIYEVVGEDYAIDLEVEMETSFQDDLELESIEFVTLAERLMDTFGESVDFTSWIANMEVEEIIAMTVGQLVEYISKSLE